MYGGVLVLFSVNLYNRKPQNRNPKLQISNKEIKKGYEWRCFYMFSAILYNLKPQFLNLKP